MDQVREIGDGALHAALLFLGRKRPGFDPQWGAEMRGWIQDFIERNHLDVKIPDDNIADEKSLRSALESCRASGIEAIIVAQPTISDGRLAPILGQLWDGPLVLWATPERPTGEMISSNSLVGTHVFASTLRQLHRPFELLIGDPREPEFVDSFNDAVHIAGTAFRLKAAKFGLIGYHAPGFIDLQADAADLSRGLGVQLFHLSVGEFLQRVNGIAESTVSEDVKTTLAMGLPFRGTDASVLPLQSRFYLAIRGLMEEENLSGLGMRCWPDLPDQVGAWPYVAASRLATEGAPVIMEGDVDGAINVFVAQGLGHGPVYVSDWLEHDRDRVTIWHTGTPPLQLCDPIGQTSGPTIAVHFNNKKPAVVEATIRAGMESTAYRLWRCDGIYHMAAFEGSTIAPSRHLLGVNGVFESSGVNILEWFDEVVHEGMPHHICIAPGHFEGALKRFARLVGVRWHG
ncbi:MAG TPA: sugar isomerase [Spirochaetia bacterium]|nr:sugar isomerase [Spirochaetia bacterium]